jgi:hypothetical protein
VEIHSLDKDAVRLSLAAGELVLLNNALNEVVHGVAVPEFDTRLGSRREEAQKLLSQFSKLLDKMKQESHG